MVTEGAARPRRWPVLTAELGYNRCVSGSTGRDADPPRFIADSMLGRLARWLRLLGHDTVYEPRWDDRTIIRIAVRDRRTILTRDRGLMARKIVRDGLLVDSEDLAAQLRQVLRAFKLTVSRESIFTRCTACNSPVVPADKAALSGQVPPYVLRRHDRFLSCPGCGRVYWGGTHQDLALRRLAEMLREDAGAAPDSAGPA